MIPIAGGPELHPKATAQPEGHTAGVGESQQGLIQESVQHGPCVCLSSDA